MNNYTSLRKGNTHSALWIAVIVLVVVELFGVAVLSSHLAAYSRGREGDIVISLTEGSARTRLTVTQKGQSSALPSQRVYLISAASTLPGGVRSARRLIAAEGIPGFSIYDENTVWSTETEIQIFKVSYDNNGDAVFTVASGAGDKVIAPGTENTYTWTLKNSEDKALEYTMEVLAWFEGTDQIIPVEARLLGPEGYMTGSADSWKPVLDLNQTRSGSLASGQTEDYVLDWRWPFERGEGDELNANDAFDTMLGNLAASGEEPLSLHILIRTIAEIDEDPPITGEEEVIITWSIISLVALILIIVLLIWMRKERKALEAE